MGGNWIDTNIVSNKYKHTTNHSVEYYLYYDERCEYIYIPKDPAKEFAARKRTPVCFSSLPRELHEERINNNRYNRICYKVVDDLKNQVILTIEEKREWIKIARKHGLLPPYVRLFAAKDGKITIDLEKCTPAQIYGYLATFRFIREDPGFVRAMVYLVNDLKVNFYVAYVLCHKICLTHSGHTVIGLTRPYMGTEKPENVLLPIHQIIGLYRFFRNPTMYDKRNMYWNRERCGSDYLCNQILKDVSKIKNVYKTEDFLNPNLVKAVESSSDKEAGEYIKKAEKDNGVKKPLLPRFQNLLKRDKKKQRIDSAYVEDFYFENQRGK